MLRHHQAGASECDRGREIMHLGFIHVSGAIAWSSSAKGMLLWTGSGVEAHC